MTTRICALLLALLLLVACGETADEPTPEPTATGGPTPTAPATDGSDAPGDGTEQAEPDPRATGSTEPTGPPATEAGPERLAGDPTTERREAEGEAGFLAVTDVRVAAHDGFDRVVFDVEGEGDPGWSVRYVDEARAAGSGQPIDVEGEAILSVALRHLAYPADLPEGIDRWDEERREGPPGGVIEEVVSGTLFEGVQTFYVGLSGQHPYVIERFRSPTRVVIDVVHGG